MNSHYQRIASEIGYDYLGKTMSWVTIEEGATHFRDMLLLYLLGQSEAPKLIVHDSMKVESYGDKTESNHNPKIVTPLSRPLETVYQKDVLVVEDMSDTGAV